MPSHHHGDVDAGQGPVVEIETHEGLDHEARGRGISRHVIGAHQIVVDGLGDVHTAQIVARLPRFLGNDAHGIGAVVAADVEEAPDLVRLEHAKNLLAVGLIGLVPRGPERRGRRERHHLEVLHGLAREVHQVLVHDASHAVDRAVDLPHAGRPARFTDDAGQRLVDHRGGAAALGDQHVTLHGIFLPAS